ncbi:DUF4271 domain-containing protein [Ferruginibacter yonginensis]|uniref:DUF4271 domain-containing protein n=1 Tax=Ferruginibacter yonginensis TaxID=1310416 RepID=A0ABV8QSA5_9BACT
MKRLLAFGVFWLLFLFKLQAQTAVDTTLLSKPTIDTVVNKQAPQKQPMVRLLDSNFLLNAKQTPQAFVTKVKNRQSNEPFFYIISLLFLLVGLMRTFFSRYFNTLFRVFFNSSLRQNQLTDQLEQAKIPSLIFNLNFVIVTGIYIYLYVHNKILGDTTHNALLCFYCIAAVGICYFVKFLVLKLSGWLTGYQSAANTYIFIVFLINKVIGIFLLPIILFMAFSVQKIVAIVIFISILLLSLVVILRYLRSYSMLQHKFKVAGFHFLLYIISVEILPIMLIYKTVMMFISNNS